MKTCLWLFSFAIISYVVMSSAVVKTFLSVPLYSWDVWEGLSGSVSTSYGPIIQLLMVSLVCSMVMYYGEMYMGYYNSSKFVMISVMFISSMYALVLSESAMYLTIGWEYLGITSVMLVMFYPNKTSCVNAMSTVMHNRCGDLMLLMFLASFMDGVGESWYQCCMNSGISIALISTCAMTKSAQFPLGAWLPAAMSAPTPISAMVHSSTLVAAGVLLLLKLSHFGMEYPFWILLLFLSALTMSMGGVLACLEKDLKKTIAFSTMSQIGMIVLFCCSGQMLTSYLHLVNHAFFKSSIFIFVGAAFMSSMGAQDYKKVYFGGPCDFLTAAVLASSFSMMGLPFSSSFYSKDIFIELCVQSSSIEIFTVTIISSMFTMIYCAKIVKFSSSPHKIQMFLSSDYPKSVYMAYITVGVILLPSYLTQTMECYSPILEPEAVSILVMIMLTYAAMKNFRPTNTLMEAAISVSNSKYALTLGYMEVSKLLSGISLSDTLIFKPYYQVSDVLSPYRSNWSASVYVLALAAMFLSM